MSGVRVLAGTRKGAFIFTSTGRRKRWTVSGPHFPGWEIYHLAASPADPHGPDTLRAARAFPSLPFVALPDDPAGWAMALSPPELLA